MREGDEVKIRVEENQKDQGGMDEVEVDTETEGTEVATAEKMTEAGVIVVEMDEGQGEDVDQILQSKKLFKGDF